MLKEEYKDMEDVDRDKPLIVGKRDWNKPVIIDHDVNNDNETKDPVMERVNR